MASHILIADYDPDFSRLLAAQLTRAGYAVSSVASAREANQVIGSTSISLAVVDGFLTDRDGESWIAAQRQAGNHTLRVIFVSAFATYARDVPTRNRLTRDLGVEYVLHKPVDPHEIRCLIDHMLACPDRNANPADSRSTVRRTYGIELSLKVAMIATSIRLAKTSRTLTPLNEARRQAHSLQGAAGSYGFTAVGDAAGRVSALLSRSLPAWDAIEASLADLRNRVEMAQSAI